MNATSSTLGVLLAVAAAVLFALGTVAQQGVAHADAREHDGVGLRRLLRSRTWLLGQGATLGAAGLQVLALALAPVAVVQPLLAVGLVLALGVRLHRERRRPCRTEVLGALLTTAGLVVFLITAGPVPGRDTRPGNVLVAATAVVAVVVVGSAALLRSGRAGAVVGGSAAGLALGLAAVLTSVALAGFAADGLRVLLTLAPWAAVGAAVVAEVGCQQAFGRGALAWSLPALSVVDPVAAVPAAHLLLGESVAPGQAHLWGPAAAVAALGVVLLAVRSDPVDGPSRGGRGEGHPATSGPGAQVAVAPGSSS